MPNTSSAVHRVMESLEVYAAKCHGEVLPIAETERAAIDIVQAVLVLTKSEIERHKVLAS